MKITKRVIASLLATLMVMASLLTVNVFAAEQVVFPDVADDYAYKDAIYSLVDDGIINGISEEGVLKFKPDKTITRAEFAKMLAVYMVGDVNLLTEKTDKFADSVNHWANTCIAYAVKAGIINGYEDGTFRPDNPVKYGEAIKMLVCAKNYGSLYSTTNPWYKGYIEIAKDMKLTANALSDGASPANRGIVAQLVYNMDYTKKLNVSNGSGGGGYVDDDEEDYEELTGVVTAVFKNNLTGESLGLTKFQIMIDDEVFRIEEDSDIQDYYKYLGKMVDVEYIEGSTNEIVSIEESGDNDTFTISAEDIFNVTSEKIEFYDEDDDEDEVKLSDKLYVIYNGQGVPLEDIDDEFIETYFDITCGEITLMNNDGGKDYEIAYVTSYKTYYVTGRSVNKDEYTFTDSYLGDSVTLKNDDEDCIVYKVTKEGGKKEASTVSGIASSKVVLSVAKPLSGGTVEAIVSTVTLKNASVNSMTDYERVKIGQEYYSVSDYYMDLLDKDESTYGFEVGDKATFYLDYAGRIVYMTKSESSEPYGYIMAYGEGSGFDSEKAVMLFDASGNIHEYPLKSKVRVDGVSVENSKVGSILEANASVINGDWADGALKNASHAQLVKYATSTENGKTVISELITIDGDLAAGDFSDGKTRIKCDSSSGSVRNFVSQGGFVVNSSTIVFSVPDDRLDKEEYKKRKYDNFYGGSTYLVEAYDIDSTTKAAKAVVVYAGGTSNAATILNNAEVRLIDFIENIPNPKDSKNPLQKVWYYTAGSTDRKSIETEEPGLLKGIEAGDLVRFAIESEKIVDVQEVFVGGKLYDYVDGAPFDTFTAKGNAIAHEYNNDDDYHRVIYATVDSIVLDDNTLNFVPYIVESNDDYDGNKDWESRSVSSAKFYDFDEDKFLTDLTLGSLTPANNGTTVDAVNASKVVIVMRAGAIKAVYVLD